MKSRKEKRALKKLEREIAEEVQALIAKGKAGPQTYNEKMAEFALSAFGHKIVPGSLRIPDLRHPTRMTYVYDGQVKMVTITGVVAQ